MKKDECWAKKGKLLCLDCGEYSDYSVEGFFVVLEDFNPFDKLDEYLKEKPGQATRYEFEYREYLARLIADGLLLEIDYGTLYLGSYSTCDNMSFRAGPDSDIYAAYEQ